MSRKRLVILTPAIAAVFLLAVILPLSSSPKPEPAAAAADSVAAVCLNDTCLTTPFQPIRNWTEWTDA